MKKVPSAPPPAWPPPIRLPPRSGPLPSTGVPKMTNLSEHCPQSLAPSWATPHASPTGALDILPELRNATPHYVPGRGPATQWKLGQLSWLPTGHLRISSLHTKLQVPQCPTTSLQDCDRPHVMGHWGQPSQPPLLLSNESCARQSPKNAL